MNLPTESYLLIKIPSTSLFNLNCITASLLCLLINKFSRAYQTYNKLHSLNLFSSLYLMCIEPRLHKVISPDFTLLKIKQRLLLQKKVQLPSFLRKRSVYQLYELFLHLYALKVIKVFIRHHLLIYFKSNAVETLLRPQFKHVHQIVLACFYPEQPFF